ncbi:MAG TPA: cation transporter [Planctomycetota bacterium]|nr:cation transporter [Planctomycetota bacterium]
MIKVGVVMAALAAAGMALAGMADPVVKIEVKNMHLCCGGCEGAATKAVEDGGGKEAKADKASKTLTFTAKDEKVAQAALDKLAAAGFWGEVEKPFSMKDDSGTLLPPKAKAVKLSSGTFKGAHNCCESCSKALKEAIKGVEGVESDDAKAKEASFTVKGAFDPAALVKAVNAAGYHVKLDKADVIKPAK